MALSSMGWRAKIMRPFAKILTLTLSASLLTIVVAAPAQAVYTSCGNVLGANAAAQSFTNNTAKVTITPKHGTIFYVDSRRGINAAYVAYSITNTATTTKKNLWVKLSNFTAASGSSLVSLANTADNMQQIATLAPSASATVYFLLVANKSAVITQTHSVEVFNGEPRLEATGGAAAGCDYTFTRVDQTIAANANKVTTISVSTTTPVLGGTVVVTVNGATGTAGAGDAAGDKDVMWVSPASVATWPTRALRLESTQIQIKSKGSKVTDTFNNSLIIMNIHGGKSRFISKSLYTSTYTFRVIGGASSNPTVKPVAQIASGTRMKHTGSYGTLPVINLTSLATPLTVTKTSSPTAYTPTSCNASTKIAVRYTITARVAAGTIGNTVLDEIVDLPPVTGSTFDTQANQATYSDASPVTNAVLGTPSTIAGETPTKLHWTGPFYVTSTTPATFNYTMCVDKVVGTYQNTAYGYVGNTIVGSNSLQVSCKIITTNGTTFTESTTCNTAKPQQPQTITFGALDPAGVGAVTPLYATSSSGLQVVFSTSTLASICTVAFNATTGFYEVTAVSAGTCVINANQSGDSSYDAASQVPQNLTIKAGQYLSVSATTSMLQSATQNFTANSLKQSDNTNTGLTVTMTSLTPDLCSVAVVSAAPNFRVTSLATTGLCSLLATQAGDVTYGAATDVYVDINIGSLQTINFTNPGNQTSTTSPSSPITISATSVNSTTAVNTNLQVAFSSLTPDVCDISTSGVDYVSPTISNGVSSTTLVKSTAGVCTLIASQDGSATYAPATDVQVTFTIGQPQTITFAKPTDAGRSANTKSITASTSSSLLITFTSTTTGICTVATGTLSGNTTTATVTFVAGGTCAITASQAGSGSWYAATSVTQSFIITGATGQTITFSQGNANISTSPITLTATSTSGLPVTFASTTSSTCTVSEIFVTLKTVGDCTIVASQSGDLTYAAASDVPVTFVIALGAAYTPIFGTPTSTDDGFTVNVTNYNASYEWSAVIAINGHGSVALGTPSGTTLPITVTGLYVWQITEITVSTTRLNYSNGSASKSGNANISDLHASKGVVGKWNSVATSADGQIVLLSGVKTKLYVSKDAGGAWRERATIQNWIATTVSDDGSILAAAVSGGQIYTSSDSGVTWSARDSNRNWRSIASSADGTKLVATVYGGQIYTSTDSGATWSPNATNLNWRAIASSADGATLAAAVYNGKIWKSYDSGASWTEISSTRKWSGISISDNGNVLAAVESGGTIHISTNSGTTWAAPASINNVVKDLWNSIACNSDCSKIALSSTSGRSAMVDNTGTYIADSMVNENFLTWSSVAINGSGSLVIGVTNSGAIRSKLANSSALITQRVASASVNFRDIAISNDGLKVITGAWNSYLFTSISGISDLTKLASSPQTSISVPTALWRAVASSSDGVKLVAAVFNGKIYTSVNSGANWTQRAVNQPWSAIASSDSGETLVATTLGGNLYNSTNYGATWTKRAVVARWSAVASSRDGRKFVATAAGGKIYTSTDSGVTWVPRATNLNWSSVASNDNGNKLVATDSGGQLGGQIWRSTDSGLNWSKITITARLWSSVASSDDGATLVATVASGKIYTSINSGTNWTSRDYVGNWKKVVSSSNGSNLFAIDYGKSIWASTNSGATWSIISAENWSK